MKLEGIFSREKECKVSERKRNMCVIRKNMWNKKAGEKRISIQTVDNFCKQKTLKNYKTNK